MRAEENKVKEKNKERQCLHQRKRRGDVRNKDWRTSREFRVRFRKK